MQTDTAIPCISNVNKECYLRQARNVCVFLFVTARKRSLGQGNIFTPVCHSVHRGGVCVVALGGCMVAPGGHAWLLQGACVVLFGGGMHGFI